MTTDDAKPWWQSRTMIGILAMLVGFIAKRFDVDLPEHAELVEIIADGLTLVGAALAWWGRLKASRPIAHPIPRRVPDAELPPGYQGARPDRPKRDCRRERNLFLND